MIARLFFALKFVTKLPLTSQGVAYLKILGSVGKNEHKSSFGGVVP